MSHIDSLLALANEAAATGPNMNEAQSGGAGRRLLPEGYALGRLVEVVELGVHPQEFGGVAKQPAPEQQLAFALWGTAPNGETYHDAEGKPHIERLLPMSISRNEKAGAYLLFKALNWKGTATSFGQLLTAGFLVKIVHKPKSKTDSTIVSRIDMKGFLPPLDPVTKQPYPIPEAPAELLKVFFWDRPTKGTWDSLFIEGQWEAKAAEGGKPARAAASKNKTQEYILAALNYAGSPLETLLGKPAGLALPSAAITPAATAPATPSVAASVATVPSVTASAVPAVANVPVVAVPLAQPAHSAAPAAVGSVPSTPATTVTTSPTEQAVAVPLVAAATVAPVVPTPAIATVAVPSVVVPSSPILPA